MCCAGGKKVFENENEMSAGTPKRTFKCAIVWARHFFTSIGVF